MNAEIRCKTDTCGLCNSVYANHTALVIGLDYEQRKLRWLL